MHYFDVDKDKKVRLSSFQRLFLSRMFHNGEQLCRYINEMWQQGKVVYVAQSPFNAVEDRKMLISSASEFAFNRELARQRDDFNFRMHKALHDANQELEYEADD